MQSNAGFELGVTTLTTERQIDELPVHGRLPEWLNGRLLRVGPACFEVGNDRYTHWFDGLSMLHRFSFGHGRIAYRNRYLHSQTFRDNMAAGAIRHGEFATHPRQTWRERVKSIIAPNLSDNANVNIAPLGGKITALTETPTPIAFDPDTLATVAPLKYADKIPSHLTTAHPHFDFGRREVLNYTTAFGRRNHYHIYRMAAGSRRRELISSIAVKRPGYMHSIAATPRFVILTEWPLTVNPLRLAVSGITGTPFIDNFRWRDGADSRLLVIDRNSGELVREAAAPCGFAFHQVNAWEEGDTIVLDICLYENADIIDCLHLSHMRTPGADYPQPKLTRLRIPSNGAVTSQELVGTPLDLPAIAYQRYNMQPYRYTYGVSTDRSDCLFGTLAKIDTESLGTRTWQDSHCYPGEPVFVPAPETRAEDDGVVLSLVLDGQAGRSFLLVLDATNFTELGRALLPHAAPFGFHGLFLSE